MCTSEREVLVAGQVQVGVDPVDIELVTLTVQKSADGVAIGRTQARVAGEEPELVATRAAGHRHQLRARRRSCPAAPPGRYRCRRRRRAGRSRLRHSGRRPLLAIEGVAAVAAAHRIVARLAEHRVVTLAAVEQVVAVPP